MQNNSKNNDLQEIITHALEELKREKGKQFDIDSVKYTLANLRPNLFFGRMPFGDVRQGTLVSLPQPHEIGGKVLIRIELKSISKQF